MKRWRGAITENKQKDLTKSSSTILVDEEAGERFGMVQQHQEYDGWQAIDQASGERPNKLRHVRSPIDQ